MLTAAQPPTMMFGISGDSFINCDVEHVEHLHIVCDIVREQVFMAKCAEIFKSTLANPLHRIVD